MKLKIKIKIKIKSIEYSHKMYNQVTSQPVLGKLF